MLAKVLKIFLKFSFGLWPLLALVYLVFLLNSKGRDLLESGFWGFASSGFFFTSVVIVLVLGFVNWYLEAGKWKFLLQPYHAVNIHQSLKIVLAGLSLGMLTPRRSGEWLTRSLYIPPAQRWNSVMQSIVGSMSQLMITLIFGLGALIFLFLTAAVQIPQNYSAMLWPSMLSLMAIALLIFVLTRTPLPALVFQKIPQLDMGKIKKAFTGKLFFGALGFSFLRYVVFVAQFVMLLFVFGNQAGVFFTFLGVSIVFLLMSAMPLSFLGDTIVRGPVAVFVFNDFFPHFLPLEITPNHPGAIIAATMLLWFINVLLPALLGVFFGFGLKKNKE